MACGCATLIQAAAYKVAGRGHWGASTALRVPASIVGLLGREAGGLGVSVEEYLVDLVV